MPDELVQPAAAATPAPVEPAAGATPPPETAAPAKGGELPDDVLKIPALQGLMSGATPAFSVDFATFEKQPEAKIIAGAKDSLMSAGVNFYHARQGNLGVIFNSLKLPAEQVKQADENGTLTQLAPPFNQVNDAIKASGADNPVLQGPQGGPTSPMVPTPPQASSGAMPSPLPASSQSKITAARVKNMQPGSPTSGATPGRGRLTAAILKRAV